MHDPMTVAFDIKYPWFRRERGRRHHATFCTIWHVDPETDGSDDSCGWFKRARHGNPAVLARMEKEFAFHWDRDRNCWFRASGQTPQLSTLSIVLQMFRVAARVFYEERRFDRSGWRGSRRFMRRHLYDVLNFAENDLDSMRTFIEQVYGRDAREKREDRIKAAASIVYGCLLRWTQPWYGHARWHVHHWKVQIIPLRTFKRWAFSRCATCGGRFGWGESPIAHQWDSDGPQWFRGESGVHHASCSRATISTPAPGSSLVQ